MLLTIVKCCRLPAQGRMRASGTKLLWREATVAAQFIVPPQWPHMNQI